jgi:hypothetical protein
VEAVTAGSADVMGDGITRVIGVMRTLARGVIAGTAAAVIGTARAVALRAAAVVWRVVKAVEIARTADATVVAKAGIVVVAEVTLDVLRAVARRVATAGASRAVAWRAATAVCVPTVVGRAAVKAARVRAPKVAAWKAAVTVGVPKVAAWKAAVTVGVPRVAAWKVAARARAVGVGVAAATATVMADSRAILHSSRELTLTPEVAIRDARTQCGPALRTAVSRTHRSRMTLGIA